MTGLQGRAMEAPSRGNLSGVRIVSLITYDSRRVKAWDGGHRAQASNEPED